MWIRNIKSKVKAMATDWRSTSGITRVQQQIDSGDQTHFTPNNRRYWVFVGLFFLCYGVNFLWDVDADTSLQNADFSENAHVGTVEPPLGDPLYDGLSRKMDAFPDFGQMGKISKYLAMRPAILDSIPSCVPLFRENYVLSSPYGERYHPIHRITKGHFGVDLAATLGTPIYCTAAGTVTHVGDDPKGHGLYVIVSHAHGFATLYGHMGTVAVTIGEELPPHEYIGTVGTTGLSTGPHLHYETIKDDKRVDPMPSFNIKYRVYALLTQKE